MRIRHAAFAACLLGLLGACGESPYSKPVVETISSFDILTADGTEVVEALQNDGRVILRGFNFATGSSELTAAGRVALERLGPALASPEAHGVKLAVVGHTDSTGGFDRNIALSVARAKAIERVLETEYRIAADRIAAVGVGPISPISDNATETGRAQNRRVELVVVE